MDNIHCFTSASLSYLDRARVLAETVKHFHPDWTLWLCLADTDPAGYTFDIDSENFDRVVRIQDLGIANFRGWAFGHDVVELCTAVKGQMLCHILQSGASKVIYLDPDIALFESLSPVVELLDNNSIVLTPHLTVPEVDIGAVADNEIGSLKHGVYNLGFIAVRGCDEGHRFAEWWRDRLLAFCHDDIPSGLFTDQRWCDLIPAFFPGVHILRDPGYNVASWNLSRRPLVMDKEGTLMAGGAVLRFFHFTKVNTVGETMLERYSGGRHEVFELLYWYRSRLKSNAPADVPNKWWAYGHFENGAPIGRGHRVLYRARPDLNSLFPDPFASGVNTYQEWYETKGRQ